MFGRKRSVSFGGFGWWVTGGRVVEGWREQSGVRCFGIPSCEEDRESCQGCQLLSVSLCSLVRDSESLCVAACLCACVWSLVCAHLWLTLSMFLRVDLSVLFYVALCFCVWLSLCTCM